MSKTRKPRTTNEQVQELFPGLARMAEATKLARKLGQVLKDASRDTAIEAFTGLMGRDEVLGYLNKDGLKTESASTGTCLPSLMRTDGTLRVAPPTC